MTRESRSVFIKFIGLFTIVLFVMIIIDGLARDINSSPFSNLFDSSGDQSEGRMVMKRYGCFACHTLDGYGGSVGPQLNGVRYRKTHDALFRWIKSPWSVKPGTRMPQLNLTDEEVAKIVGYLETKDSIRIKK